MGPYEHGRCKVCCEGGGKKCGRSRERQDQGVQFYCWILLDFGFLETGDGLRVGDGEWSHECV